MAKKLNDAFRADVLRFLASPAGLNYLETLKSRRPSFPKGTESAHEFHRINGAVEGFEKCLDELMEIPQELQQDEAPQKPDPTHIAED